MRSVLLDENLPRQFAGLLQDQCEVSTDQEVGWAGKENGELLQLADEQFEVFVSGDQNLACQQNLSELEIGIVVMVAQSNKLEDLLPLLGSTRLAIENVQSGRALEVGR